MVLPRLYDDDDNNNNMIFPHILFDFEGRISPQIQALLNNAHEK